LSIETEFEFVAFSPFVAVRFDLLEVSALSGNQILWCSFADVFIIGTTIGIDVLVAELITVA
jgi:hypothetical protein